MIEIYGNEDGTGLVYDCKELEQYKMLPDPIGTDRKKPMQNINLVAPYHLFREQVMLLLELKVANLRTKFTFKYELDQKYKIFKQLWEMGYRIVEAKHFGGDFLLYENEKHSKYICIIGNGIQAQDLICMARIATNVNKILMFCWLDDMGTLQRKTVSWI